MEDKKMKTIKVEQEIWQELLMLKYDWKYGKVSDVVKQVLMDAGYSNENNER